MKNLIVMMLVLFAISAQAEIYRATVQVGGDYLVYGSGCRLQKRIPERSQSVRRVDLKVEAGNVLTFKSELLSSGNCSQFSALDLPKVLQLEEGVTYEIPLDKKGASAISGTYGTIFTARWVRQADGTLYVNGGCSWKYFCGGDGYSDVTITTLK